MAQQAPLPAEVAAAQQNAPASYKAAGSHLFMMSCNNGQQMHMQVGTGGNGELAKENALKSSKDTRHYFCVPIWVRKLSQ
jgi:hypothetical protein